MNPTTFKKEVEAIVTELVVRWARGLLADRPVPRRNRRIVLGDRDLAERVRQALLQDAGPAGWFVVATSADEDAVRLRNQAPSPPPGVTDQAPIVYLVFWCEAEKGHPQNAQSLRDLTEVEVSELLAIGAAGELSLETRMRERCQEAGQSWGDKLPGRSCAEQLEQAWDALRSAIRTGRGGRDGTLPFVEHPDAYASWLWSASITDAEWAATPMPERPALLVRRWGEALPQLGLFRIAALASVLGIPVAPDPKPVKKAVSAAWPARAKELLAENQAAAVDFGALEDQIAGKLSVEVRLAQEKRVRLAHADEPGARAALVRFCRGEDSDALSSVEWLFHEKPDDRRSASHGLKGLLIARNASAPRISPLERAYEALRDLLVKNSGDDLDCQGQAASFAEFLRQRVKADARTASGAASALRLLASGHVPELVGLEPEIRTGLATLATAPALDSAALQGLATTWEHLAEVDDRPIEAPTLLLGLARLLHRRLAERQRAGEACAVGAGLLVLKAGDVAPLEVSTTAWHAEDRLRVSAWLRDRVLPAEDEETTEASDFDAGEESELIVSVSLKRNGEAPERLGEVALHWTPLLLEVTRAAATINAWSMADGDAPNFRPQHLLQVLQPHHQVVLGGLYESVAPAFQLYLQEVTSGHHSALAHLLAPLPPEARAWVDSWSEALAWAETEATGSAADHGRLQQELIQAVGAGDMALAKSLGEQLMALGKQPMRSRPSPKDVRSLLQAGTAELRVGSGPAARRHVVLLPHHPLVLRLRVLSEELLCDCLRTMAVGWPQDGLSDLGTALETWGAPEPQHIYGWWDGEPLAFDEWLSDFRLARFGPFGDPDGADAGRQGIREATRVLDRYGRLFPAAADRLALRIRADGEGEWANRLIDMIGRQPELDRLSADLDVFGIRDLSALTRESWRQPERRPLLELHDDGTEPRIRLRGNPSSPSAAHVAFVVGETVPELQPRIDTVAPPAVVGSAWDEAVLFRSADPELLSASFHVGDPPDPLCRRVALAVGYARSEQFLVHVERYSFDETKVKEPIRSLHAGAHWLTLSSRRPLYRAVQAAGDDVATLLDFRTTWDSGRPLHVCVSVSRGELQRDLHRLAGLLRSLLAVDIPNLPAAVIAQARRLAPGFAINCAGAPSAAAVEGLLGLLLSARAVRASSGPESLILALDQHQGLLARSKDRSRSDLLALSLAKAGTIEVAVAESKLTLNPAGPTTPVVSQALGQVKTTLERL